MFKNKKGFTLIEIIAAITILGILTGVAVVSISTVIANGKKEHYASAEKNLTLDISKYMYDRFKELNVPVSLTRSDDVTLSPKERVNKVKSFYGDSKDVLVISNHLNAGGRYKVNMISL